MEEELIQIRIRRCRLRNTRVSFLKIISKYGEEHVLDFKSVLHCMFCMCCIRYTLVMLFTCQKRIEFMKMLSHKGICCFITTNSLLYTSYRHRSDILFYFDRKNKAKKKYKWKPYTFPFEWNTKRGKNFFYITKNDAGITLLKCFFWRWKAKKGIL